LNNAYPVDKERRDVVLNVFHQETHLDHIQAIMMLKATSIEHTIDNRQIDARQSDFPFYNNTGQSGSI
jgi:hypothetical protein